MATTVDSLAVKTFEEVRADWLRTYRNGLINRGVVDPSVGSGSEAYLRATALAQQIVAATANTKAAANAQMPDTATGDDLVREAALKGLSYRNAGPSSGKIVLDSTIAGSVGIPTGAQLIDENGLTYQVIVGGQFADGASIDIESIDTGESTNLVAGSVLRWTAPPEFVQPTALVGSGGLTGGVGKETEEGLRGRLLDRYRNPPNGVNSAALNIAVEASSSAVQKCFAFPACNGPSTVHLAAVGAPSATNKSRIVNSIVMSTKVVPGGVGAVPEYAECVVTTVQDYPTNVSIGLSLPSSKTASPAGPGGGWLDGNPFPVLASPGYVEVLDVILSTNIQVASDVAPIIGDTICWLSTHDWTLVTAKIVTVPLGGVSPYYIGLDTPLVDASGNSIALGDYIFPGAEQMPAYVKAALDAFAGLGPGEKTNAAGLIPRARRRPLTVESWPSSLTTRFLQAFANRSEVYASGYLYRETTTPPLPSVISDAPYILVPRQLGFYPLE